MKKKLINTFILAMIIAVIGGCKKSETLDANLVGLGGDTWTATAIDNWITDNYTKPYNIQVKYKWDGSELDMSKTLVPVQEDKVIPVMDAIKKTWIVPYASLAGEDFIKKLSQKQFVLVGSAQYNTNSITLGEAEGGRKIVLFVINDFVNTNKAEVRRMLHTIHHEFGHILNQNIAVTPNYQRITPGLYDATWFNYTDAEAQALGFITAYSRSNKDDDFVEMLATLLVDGDASFNNIVNTLWNYDSAGLIIKDSKGVYSKNTTARLALQAKRDIVVSYMKTAFNIDLYALQAKTQQAIEDLSPTADFSSLLGPGKTYTVITVNPQKLTGLSAKFLTAYNTANTKLQTDKSFYIDEIALRFTAANKLTLRVKYYKPLSTTPNTAFNADFDYTITTAGNVITLAYATQPTTGTNYIAARDIEASIPTLTAYFTGQQFTVKWVDDIIPQSKSIFGGLVKTTDATSYLFGSIN